MDLNRAKKAELIELCEEQGLDSEGTVKELRERILAWMKTPDGGFPEEPEEDAVKESEGAVAEMFPELEKLSDEDVDEAIDEGRRKADDGDLEPVADDDEPDCPEGFHDEGGTCVPDEDETESLPTETEVVPGGPFPEEVSKVHTPLEPCKNCGTDLERFPPFFDPESDASRCPNCGHGL